MSKKLATMSDIARLAGVSKNTVSLALRNSPQIPEVTRRRIADIANELDYRKNAVVAELMSRMRQSQAAPFHSTLALLNAHSNPAAFESHPTIPTYVHGCNRRAEQLGYRLDEFWLHDPGLDGRRLVKIFRARGIRGAVVVGLMRENRLPERHGEIWRNFPVVVTGVRTRDPELSFACTDHHMLAVKAFHMALKLGYRKPALVIDPVIDRLVDCRFSAGVHTAQQEVSARHRAKPFFLKGETGAEEERFFRWFQTEQPDAILTLYNVVKRWLARRGVAAPRDIGLVQLEWRRDSPDWAGMDQHNDVVGEAAVEMLIGMLHVDHRGVPEFPRAALVGSSWKQGETVKAQALVN